MKAIYITDKVSFDIYENESAVCSSEPEVLLDFTGYDYGARGGKTLSVFIEDLNLPEKDTYGVQEVNEVMKRSDSTNVYILDRLLITVCTFLQLLRQLLDNRALYKLQKPFEWRLLEDLVVIATMNTSFKQPATGCRTSISKRLKVCYKFILYLVFHQGN